MKIALARLNPTDFCEYVFGWDVQSFQSEWHRLFNDHDHLLIFASVEHGKSMHAIAECLWRIGTNPNVRIAYISSTGEQAQKLFGFAREIIEGDSEAARRYREVFPHVRRGTGVYRRWDSEAIIVERSAVMPDYTMCAIGVGKSFLGARYDIVVFDDILDFENTATEGQREKVWKWITSTALTRVVKGGKALFICTAWNPDDAAHRCESSGRWITRRTPAISTLPNGEPDWDHGTIAWPSAWPMDRLKAKMQEVGGIEFARQFLCVAVSDTLSRFKEASFEYALQAGKDYSITTIYIPERKIVPAAKPILLNSEPVFVGVDLSIKKATVNDLAALFIACVYPNMKRRLLDVRMGHMDGEDILDALAQARLDYPGIVGCYVEDNGAQEYLIQFSHKRKDLPPIHGFTTTERKYHPEYGVPSLAVEFDQGLWILPSKERQETGNLDPKVRHLLQGLRAWSPRDHTPDDIMAMWLCREAIVNLYGMEIHSSGEKYDFAKPEARGFDHDKRPHMNPRFF